MTIQYTLSIIKPDGVRNRHIGDIYRRYEDAGFRIVAAKMVHLTPAQAESFYAVHAHRPFYKDLVTFMSSGPIMVQVLARENAIAYHRDLMGATDPKQAAAGTLRADFATSIDENVVHGSDSEQTAPEEIKFFFDVAALCEYPEAA